MSYQRRASPAVKLSDRLTLRLVELSHTVHLVRMLLRETPLWLQTSVIGIPASMGAFGYFFRTHLPLFVFSAALILAGLLFLVGMAGMLCFFYLKIRDLHVVEKSIPARKRSRKTVPPSPKSTPPPGRARMGRTGERKTTSVKAKTDGAAKGRKAKTT